MVKYRVWKWGNTITPIEVVSETKKFIRTKDFPNRNQAKISQFECFFDTWEEAYEYTLTKIMLDIDLVKCKLRAHESELETLKLMRKP